MDVVAQAAAGFGLRPEAFRPLAGASGTAWGDGEVVMRVGARVGLEVMAAAAAAARVPVPRVLDSLELEDVTAVLFERVPGRPAAELAMGDAERGAAVGRACGALHDALAGVEAPAGLRHASDGGRLLHLDLHPFNVLVDDAGAVTAVLDWANAAAGDPELDRARTWSVLTLDPAARELAGDAGWAALTRAWLETARADDLSPAARAWACEFMLADLGERHTEEELAHVRAAVRR